MNVLILELGGSHFENIYSLIILLKRKNCEVHLICNEKIKDLLPDKNMIDGIMGAPDKFSLSTQLKTFQQIRKYIKQNAIDTLIIGTTEIDVIRNFSFFIPPVNTIGIVHNAKKLEKKITLSRITFTRIKKLLVFGNYLFSELKALKSYDVGFFSAIYFPPVQQLTVKKKENEFWVTVPGGIISSKRDYISFLKSMAKYTLPGNMKIIFLGYYNPAEEPLVTAILKPILAESNHIITFDHYLDFNTFHSYIQQSDIMLPIFKLEGDDFYLDKRVSGSIHLGLGYKLPFLMPTTYSSNTDIDPYTIYYKTYDELITLLINLCNSPNDLDAIKSRYSQCALHNIQEQADRLFNFIAK